MIRLPHNTQRDSRQGLVTDIVDFAFFDFLGSGYTLLFGEVGREPLDGAKLLLTF